MKKIVSVLLVLITIACLFQGCGKKKSDIKIGLAAPEATHGWVAGVAYYAEKYCKEKGIEYNLTTSGDAEEMEKNLDVLADWGAQTIIMWPQWTGMGNAVADLTQKGIHVVSFDVDIDSNGIHKVMGNNYNLGYQCAQYIAEKAGDAASVILFNVPSAGSVSELRTQGFYDYLKETDYDIRNILEYGETEFSREIGYSEMKSVLEENAKIDAVFCMDDETAIGVVKAITESGRTDIKAVTGGGGMQEYFSMIADPKYESLGLCSALYSPSMIENAIDIGIDLCEGKNANRIVVLPTTIVTSGNVDEYIDPQNTVY